uniref:hypothetical protein n=1 Tax=Pleurosigma intermedium TaxID=197753 RepID=UPI0021820658|nr:hypothetical protein N4L43_pgp145 [Pleurosigma intermedium]UVG41975.1 hypothetical protein [Pleurosigma intermedium]
MYINYVNDRKSLGYKCLVDTKCGNRLVLITDSSVVFVKNVTLNGKRKIFVIIVGMIIIFSDVKSANAIGMSPPLQPRVVRIMSNQNTNRLIQPSKVKLDLEIKPKIIMPSLSKNVKTLPTYIYLMDDKFLRRPEISSIILEMRGGSWSAALIGNTIFVAVLYGIWLLASGSEGFVQQPNPGWGLGNNLYEPPGLVRPADCETQLYAGSPQQSLKTEASRNQPNPKDRWILVESRPELIMRRGQAQFKTKDHGALAGLPYQIKKNGGTSTARTEENIDRFMDVVEEIIENPNSIWFEDGTYQAGTNREVKSINIYNEEENRIAIFKRSTGEFMTFCEPNDDEREDLLETGNFGGQFGWFSGQAKNFPPKDKAEQNVADEITPIDSFESHVMGITPAPAYEFSSVDEGQNPGFTPLNSFESDVMGITPLDSSSSDYQI